MGSVGQHGDSSVSKDGRRRSGHPGSDFVCKVKYTNTLPSIPFDQRLLKYPLPISRFVEYKQSSLERNFNHEIITPHDLGVHIDVIDSKTTYAVDPNAVLHPDDEILLEDDDFPVLQDSKRSHYHKMAVPWLKKTEYISNEFNRYGKSGEKTETKVGYNVKKLLKEENLLMDKNSQIEAINEIFADAQKPIERHHSKPGVHAVDVLPLFPDLQLWGYPFAQVTFDSAPAPVTQMEEMNHAMIKGVQDEDGAQFVAYCLPTGQTMKKRKRDAENGDNEYDYKMTHEYDWGVKNKATKGYEENYFFVFRDGAVYYNELETSIDTYFLKHLGPRGGGLLMPCSEEKHQVQLSKRRPKAGMNQTCSRLLVRHRSLNEKELLQQERRLSCLDIPKDAEDEPTECDRTHETENYNGEKSASKDGHGKESIDEDGVMRVANAEEMEEEDAEDGKSNANSSISCVPSPSENEEEDADDDKSNANSSISCVPSLSENEEEEEERDQKEWDDKDLFGSSDSE